MKKIIWVLLFIIIGFPVLSLADVTLTDSAVDRAGFVVNANSADLSGCETIKAAVAGQAIFIERVVIISNTAINYTIGAGETDGAVTTVLIGPVYVAANSITPLTFTRPIKLAAAVALTADASGAGAVTIVIQGYVK